MTKDPIFFLTLRGDFVSSSVAQCHPGQGGVYDTTIHENTVSNVRINDELFTRQRRQTPLQKVRSRLGACYLLGNAARLLPVVKHKYKLTFMRCGRTITRIMVPAIRNQYFRPEADLVTFAGACPSGLLFSKSRGDSMPCNEKVHTLPPCNEMRDDMKDNHRTHSHNRVGAPDYIYYLSFSRFSSGNSPVDTALCFILKVIIASVFRGEDAKSHSFLRLSTLAGRQ